MGTKQLSKMVIKVFVEMISGTVHHLQKSNPNFDKGIFYRELLKQIRERAESGHRFSNRREVREQVKGRIDNNIDMATGKCVIGCCDGEEPPDNLNSKSSIFTTTRSEARRDEE